MTAARREKKPFPYSAGPLAGYPFTPVYPSLIAEASMLSLSSSLPSDTAALAEIGLSGHVSAQIKVLQRKSSSPQRKGSTSVLKALSLLRQFGLPESAQIETFDNYNEYKGNCPRLHATLCVTPRCTLTLLSDTSCGLAPLGNNLVSHKDVSRARYYHRRVLDILRSAEVADLPMPCLPPFLEGLCQMFLSAGDDIA
jgi:hypothetical protein